MPGGSAAESVEKIVSSVVAAKSSTAEALSSAALAIPLEQRDAVARGLAMFSAHLAQVTAIAKSTKAASKKEKPPLQAAEAAEKDAPTAAFVRFLKDLLASRDRHIDDDWGTLAADIGIISGDPPSLDRVDELNRFAQAALRVLDKSNRATYLAYAAIGAIVALYDTRHYAGIARDIDEIGCRLKAGGLSATEAARQNTYARQLLTQVRDRSNASARSLLGMLDSQRIATARRFLVVVSTYPGILALPDLPAFETFKSRLLPCFTALDRQLAEGGDPMKTKVRLRNKTHDLHVAPEVVQILRTKPSFMMRGSLILRIDPQAVRSSAHVQDADEAMDEAYLAMPTGALAAERWSEIENSRKRKAPDDRPRKKTKPAAAPAGPAPAAAPAGKQAVRRERAERRKAREARRNRNLEYTRSRPGDIFDESQAEESSGGGVNKIRPLFGSESDSDHSNSSRKLDQMLDEHIKGQDAEVESKLAPAGSKGAGVDDQLAKGLAALETPTPAPPAMDTSA
eukprot:m.290345 g.290345  ORF g.290345 m.290345 type:complete len:512 (-) comp12279_c0_seq1:135-1670(-)